MAKSKAYLSFVLLFTFLLSSHVLAHELREITSPKNQHSYSDEGNVFKHPNPASSPNYKTPRFEDVGIVIEAGARLDIWFPPPPAVWKSTRPYNAEVDELIEPKRYSSFPRASGKIMPGTGSRHYSHPATYNPSNLELTELKNYVDASVPRYRVPPPGIDWRNFHAFQGKTFGTKNGDKTGYNDVPRMEDIGEGTKN